MIAVIATLLPMPASAAGTARLELRPHCEEINQNDCVSYDVRDPESQQTPVLKANDMIDMDLIIRNPEKKPVQRFRAWIAYDPTSIEGMTVTISSQFPVPTPGENAFAPVEGYIKLSGTATAPISDEIIVVGRIKGKVTQPRTESAPLAYFDATGTAESRTGVFEKTGSTETNILMENPGSLHVRFEAPAAGTSASSAAVSSTAQSAAAVSSAMSVGTGMTYSSSAASSVAMSAAGGTVFALLQVQGVRITTEGSSVFLAWDVLPSSELVGYNVYYGTTSGRYIQRRGVEGTANSITIRALPTGTTYYFAVRGINAAGQETEFSREVGISVGNPSTSTSPLTGGIRPTPTPGTGGTVAGETGMSSVLIAFFVISALTGTFIAFRRQLRADNA